MNSLALIDDDPILLSVLEEIFGLRGLQVTAYGSPLKALEELPEARPDAVLSDCIMPHIDGFELCRKLRGSPGFTRTPIFLMSAKHSISELSKAMMSGADEYVIKPFSPDDMMKKLAETYEKKNNPIRIKPGGR
ncbi:response regulator receiver domain-containing protein [Paenibacillus mucilaginosus 3016]|uniref:Response regulator receiver domain-containing protein n=1 Tax=Paenibacillus mucilaginosus 3016 TaxID=1116391 RepID=H6NPL5_9BACL|nr:response regulator [Paenibacillus mucilaginosus]AFC32627.1 response regulator receiver domain-containing protein [Paenibacillus mucilaginosus 3016]WFA21099.1 response regulator [Paenibacillus mucilaginosus]